MDDDTTLQIQAFPAELKREVKAVAALNGLSLKAAVIEAMQSWVYRNRPADIRATALEAGPDTP